jgi:hypothetical protein
METTTNRIVYVNFSERFFGRLVIKNSDKENFEQN